MIPYLRTAISSNVRGILQNSTLFQRLLQYTQQPENQNNLINITCLLILGCLLLLNTFINFSYPSYHLRKTEILEMITRQPTIKRTPAPGSTLMVVLGTLVFFFYLYMLLRLRRAQVSQRSRLQTQIEVFQNQFAAMNRMGISDDAMMRLNLALRRGNFDGDDYELLQSLDANNESFLGPTQEQLDRLPCEIITHVQEISYREEKRTCSVCLGGYEEGHFMRTIPCFHQFHKECIDQWLKTNPTCPICKVYAIQ